MIVDFKHSPGELVKMKIDSSNTPYMVLSMTHDNGGNYYKIFDGETELMRSEFELEKVSHKNERRAGFRGKGGVKEIETNTIEVNETD